MIESVIDWAEKKGIINNATPRDQMLKVVEEVGELADALGKGNNDLIADAIGDITITLIIQARLCGLDYEECVSSALDEILGRSGKMINGIFVKDTK